MANHEIPRYGLGADFLHGWLLNAVSEGAAWLAQQRPSQTWEAARAALSGLGGEGADTVSGQSNVRYPKTKRIIRELVASLASFRHEGVVKPRWNRELYPRAMMLSALDEHWYTSTEVDAYGKYRALIQYGQAYGTGYGYETWDPTFYGPGMGEIRMDVVGPEDVTFLQLPKDGDLQRAYAVIIRQELPLSLAKAVYGRSNSTFADNLTADRQSPGWIAKGLQKVQQFLAPALRVMGRTSVDQPDSAFPTVDIFHMYTMDASVNETPFPVKMGAFGTNWSYVVPAIGDPIPTEQINTETGEFFTRPARRDDCRLFPLRRLTIFARTGIGYDGSSPWWHGQVPLAALKYGDWAWEALGTSQTADLLNIEAGIVELMRQIEDTGAARLDPPALYDDNLVSRGFAEAFNPRRAGARAAANLNAGKVIEFPVDANLSNVPEWIPTFIENQERRMDYLSGVADMIAIAKAKQVPGADTLEKLMEMAGPIVQDMVRAMEKPLVQLGSWRLAYYFQFYTLPRMITVAGPTGTPADIQYLPTLITPAQAPGESLEAYNARRKGSITDFRYDVTESGINEIHRMTTKLFYLQLMAKGFPISWWTMAEVAKIPNFGPAPDGANTELEKWVAQQHIIADLQSIAAENAAMDAAAQGVPPGGAPGGGQPPKPGQPGQSGPGRPNSFNKPPHIEQKDGGTRSTIATS